MSEMIERVARALHAEIAGSDPDELIHAPYQNSWEAPTKRRWEQWEDAARAAIEAMREPDELMLAAVKPEPVHLYHGRDEEYRRRMQMATSADRLAFLTDWQRAIDAALADSESKP